MRMLCLTELTDWLTVKRPIRNSHAKTSHYVHVSLEEKVKYVANIERKREGVGGQPENAGNESGQQEAQERKLCQGQVVKKWHNGSVSVAGRSLL